MTIPDANETRGQVLIVDDDLDSLRLLSDLLIAAGYDVRGAPDGATALTLVESAPPDVVLLDIRMPGMDGYEVCRRLMADGGRRPVPVLFLSSLDEMKDKVEGFEAGGVDFITKPFEEHEVLARVNVHVAMSVLRRDLEQRVAERVAELDRSEERYRTLVEASPSAIMAIRDEKFVFSNPAGARLLGYTNPDEIVGLPAVSVVAPAFRERVTERLKRLAAGENNPPMEIELVRADGSTAITESRSVAIELDDGLAAVIVARDVTEQRETQRRLRLTEVRLRAFMDYTPVGIYMKDSHKRHVYANRAMVDVFGISVDEFVGTTSHDFMPTSQADQVEALDEGILSGKLVFDVSDVRTERSGKTRWWQDTKFPLEDPSGERLVGGIAVDVTDRVEKEERLKQALDEIVELKARLEQENVYLRGEVRLEHKHGRVVGSSEPIKRALQQVEQVAETDSTVLIEGETGTGKELLADAIHNLSSRKNRTLVKVNCAALPDTLVESELFGREKGAYTGALTKQAGRFEIADKSTIFLDEVGELSAEVQAKLLRILQEGQFERLGSSTTSKVDVRLIAASNRDLQKAVEEGRFREDLYYRLRVFPIVVPPLRERQEDIPQLVWHFVREFADRMGKRIEHVSKRTMEALQRYPWPGNVRELRNVIEHAMIISTGSKLMVELPSPVGGNGSPVNATLEDVERQHIMKVLEQTRWRVRGAGGAAEILGLKPTTLDFRMKKLGIERPE